MNLSVKLIRRLSRSGLSLQVILDTGEFAWVPLRVCAEKYQPGERDIVIEVADWFGRQLSEELWRERMQPPGG